MSIEELLAEAKRRYNIGDMINCAFLPEVGSYKIKEFTKWKEEEITTGSTCHIYYRGKWAKNLSQQTNYEIF